MRIVLTTQALTQLKTLPVRIQKQVIKKLRQAESRGDRGTPVYKLHGVDLSRIRIGDYRAIGSVDGSIFNVFVIEHRSRVYKELR